MIQRRYKVFIAIPYDGATRPMYEGIVKYFEDPSLYGLKFQFVIGNLPPAEESPVLEFEAFRAQNSNLVTQFLFQIRSSDIIIADLSYNNANVHLELGIALAMNKNILRVSGRTLTELSFDVRNHEVHNYVCAERLIDTIKKYLDVFYKIKAQSVDDPQSPTYQSMFHKGETIEGRQFAEPGMFDEPAKYPTSRPISAMRDGELRVRFKFIQVGKDEDWFAAVIRNPSTAYLAGYLLYVRKDGRMELLDSFANEILQAVPNPQLELGTEYTLQVEFEGSYLRAWLGGFEAALEQPNLNYQSPGSVSLMCFRSTVEFRFAEIVNRDTINPLPTLDELFMLRPYDS